MSAAYYPESWNMAARDPKRVVGQAADCEQSPRIFGCNEGSYEDGEPIVVGRRGRNLREGDLAEGIGLELLRPFAAVAPVPRTEDVGIDAVCNLLKLSGQFLIAEDSFVVQIKSVSVRTVEFHDDAYDWLLGLKTPMFLASVRLSDATVALHTMQRAVDRVDNRWRGVTAYLDTRSADDGDDYDHGPDVHDNVHHIYLGPPVLRWSATEAATSEFKQTAYTVMKAWIAWEETNLRLRPYKWCNVPRWRTGEVPVWSSSRHGPGIDPGLDPRLVSEFAQTFGAAMSVLVNDFGKAEAESFLNVVSLLRCKGIKSHELLIAEIMLRHRAGLDTDATP